MAALSTREKGLRELCDSGKFPLLKCSGIQIQRTTSDGQPRVQASLAVDLHMIHIPCPHSIVCPQHNTTPYWLFNSEKPVYHMMSFPPFASNPSESKKEILTISKASPRPPATGRMLCQWFANLTLTIGGLLPKYLSMCMALPPASLSTAMSCFLLASVVIICLY